MQRREWIKRIIDHDGTQGEEGGIEAWLRLGEACGLKREDITSLEYVLPGVRFAVDAYVNFARRAPWQEAVCSSLTELFAPEIHQQAPGQLAAALSLDRAAGLRLLPPAPVGSAARRRARTGGHAGLLQDARSSRNGRWTSCSSSSTCSGACSTRCRSATASAAIGQADSCALHRRRRCWNSHASSASSGNRRSRRTCCCSRRV